MRLAQAWSIVGYRMALFVLHSRVRVHAGYALWPNAVLHAFDTPACAVDTTGCWPSTYAYCDLKTEFVLINLSRSHFSASKHDSCISRSKVKWSSLPCFPQIWLQSLWHSSFLSALQVLWALSDLLEAQTRRACRFGSTEYACTQPVRKSAACKY